MHNFFSTILLALALPDCNKSLFRPLQLMEHVYVIQYPQPGQFRSMQDRSFPSLEQWQGGTCFADCVTGACRLPLLFKQFCADHSSNYQGLGDTPALQLFRRVGKLLNAPRANELPLPVFIHASPLAPRGCLVALATPEQHCTSFSSILSDMSLSVTVTALQSPALLRSAQ